MVRSYIERGFDIRYYCNPENLGMDRNFIRCFNLAQGKYVVVFGDDDIFLDGAIARIISVLQGGDYGLVYVSSYGYDIDYVSEAPKQNHDDIAYYRKPEDFLTKINYWITFLSGNIFNKSLIGDKLVVDEFAGTNLVQVHWFLTALSAADCSVFLSSRLIATKIANTGGYNVCKVFATNLNTIMRSVLVDPKFKPVVRHINSLLLRQFLPGLVFNTRNGNSRFDFVAGNYYEELTPLYRSYVSFWVFLVPVIVLPLPLARMWYLLVRVVNKAVRMFSTAG